MPGVIERGIDLVLAIRERVPAAGREDDSHRGGHPHRSRRTQGQAAQLLNLAIRIVIEIECVCCVRGVKCYHATARILTQLRAAHADFDATIACTRERIQAQA